MKKILLQLCSDRLANVFDTITAYDTDVDCVLQYSGVAADDVRDMVHGAMFTRSGDDLKNTAILVGGSDLPVGEAILQAVRAEFFGPVRVSVMLDSNGCNTTAAAIVTRVLSAGEVTGKKVVVLAGTGPVGLRTAALLAREGAQVTLTSRRLARAEAACASIEERFGVGVSPAEAMDAEGVRRALEGAYVAIATGAAGVRLLPETVWVAHSTLRVLAGVNAVPPLGIEGIEPAWDGEVRDGKIIFGAYGVGGLKTRVHRACILRLFERNDLVLDAEEIHAIAREVAGLE
ncbi:MAG: methylenetetrahydromethanopterin dehydrogenase [Chloroflexi bacterium]|nr:methylenetetrahydromethanopterin dehydrogenase [Chloroflexota bacterium]